MIQGGPALINSNNNNVNNKMKKNFNFGLLLMLGATLFTACSDDDEPPFVTCPVTVTEGMFVLNEGAYFSGISGSLSYLDYSSQTLSNGVFAAKNGRSLGGTPNDMLIYGSKMYIAVTDENRVEVLNASTLESLGFIAMTQPRKLAATQGRVFVTSYTGTVSSVDTVQQKVVATSEKIGANLEGIAVRGQYLYVCNAWNNDYTYNKNVVKLQASTLAKVKDITVTDNPVRIATDGTDIYVQSTGNYADIAPSIQKLDADDQITPLCQGTYMSYANQKIYYISMTYDENWNAITRYGVYDLVKGEDATFIQGDEVFSPCGIAADPHSGQVYISSNNQGAMGGIDYAGPGYIVAYGSDGTLLKKYDAGVAPSVFLFNTVTQTAPQE